jgi:hypothetical protein
VNPRRRKLQLRKTTLRKLDPNSARQARGGDCVTGSVIFDTQSDAIWCTGTLLYCPVTATCDPARCDTCEWSNCGSCDDKPKTYYPNDCGTAENTCLSNDPGDSACIICTGNQ